MTTVLAPTPGAAGTRPSPAPRSAARADAGTRPRRRAVLAAPLLAVALAGVGALGSAAGPTAASASAAASGSFAAASAPASATASTPASTAPVAVASCPGATSSVRVLGPTKASEAVRCLVNVERKAVGLRPLAANARLARAARGHAADMDRRDYFDHASPAGTSFDDRVTASGYRWSTVGENIAAGQTTPRAVVRAWIRSKGHCQNIMSPAYTQIGVGAVAGGPSPYGGPTWVQDFARPRGTKAPKGPSVRCSRKPVV